MLGPAALAALARCAALLAAVGALKIVALGGGLGLRSDALRMINLDVPQMALQGDTIQLSCSYSLAAGDRETRKRADTPPAASSAAATAAAATDGSRRRSAFTGGRGPGSGASTAAPEGPDAGGSSGELLYAIKWYKDEREFFRYVSQDWPHKQALPMESVNIDMDKSDNQTVALRNVTLKTSGLFRCEVSTDAPSFLTKSIERKVLIYSLPTEGPSIEPPARQPQTGRQLHYLGDQLELSCASRESKPPARLDWILNEQFNLTAGGPRDPQGQPLARVTNKRLVRLAHAHDRPPAAGRSGAELEANGALRAASPHSRTTLAYTLAHDGSGPGEPLQLVASAGLATNGSRAPQTIPLSLEDLEQVPEIALSTLQLSIDASLLRFLAEPAASWDGQTRPRAADGSFNWRTRKAHAQADPVSRASTRSPSPASDDELRQRRSMPSKFPLRVRCVARVLHLKMSDDIRLLVINRTRASEGAPEEGAMFRTNRQEARETNSAGKASAGRVRQMIIASVLLLVVFCAQVHAGMLGFCINEPGRRLRLGRAVG